jgi:hopanoid biosynthesis associated RND transporter like protein HpnN
MGARLLYRYSSWIYRNAWAIVIAALFLSALSTLGSAFYLKTQTGILDMYSENNDTNRRFLSYSKKFGAVEYLIIVFEGKSENRRREAMETLAARLKADPDQSIKDIFYKVDLEFFKKHAFQFLNQSQAEATLTQVTAPEGGIRRLFAAPSFAAFVEDLNRSLEQGLREGAAPPADAASQFAQSIQPILLLTDFLAGQDLSETVMTSRLQTSGKEHRTLDDHGYLRTDDRAMHIMLIRPSDRKQDYKLAQKLVERVRREILPVEAAFPDVPIGVTGGPALNNDQFRISQRDMTLASIFAFVSTALLFVLAFKSFMRPFLGLATLALNISIVFGFATLTVGHLNLFSLAFVVILVGQGTYYGVHVIARYEEELQKGRSVEEAIQETLVHVFGNVTTSAATTAAAFFATMLVDLKGFAELGWIAGSGIVISAISMQLVLPALLVLYDRRRPREKLLLANRLTGAGLSRWSQTVLRHIQTYSYLAATAMVLLGGAGAYLFYSPTHGIAFDNNLLNLQAKGTEAVQYEKKLIQTSMSPRAGIFLSISAEQAQQIADQARAQSTVQRVEWLGDFFPEGTANSATRGLLKQAVLSLPRTPLASPDLAQLQSALLRLKANLEKVESQALNHPQGESLLETADRGIDSIDQILEKLSKAKAKNGEPDPVLAAQLGEFQERFFGATRGMLRRAAESETLSLNDLPEELRGRFLASDGTYAIYAYPKVDIWERGPLTNFVEELREVNVEVTGPPIMFFEILRLVHRDFFRAAFYSAIAIFLIFLIDFRSLGYALLASAPLVLGVFTLFGLMSLFNLPFNTANMIALPMILGIGADNGVHMIHRFREEIDGHLEFLFKSTGKALFITYLDSITSFIGLAFANHQGLAHLGIVVILGLTTCTLAGFLFLPAAMLLIQRYRASRALSARPVSPTN